MSARRGEARIKEVFSSARREGRACFMPYVCGGDPSFEQTRRLMEAYAKSGADLIEFGVPFSDPIADGPTIQSAGDRAIRSGATLAGLLDLLKGMRSGGFDLPAVVMTYYNLIHKMGLEAFALRAAGSGVDGLIIPDLPLEESSSLVEAIERAGVSERLPLVQLIAPTTPPERAKRLANASRGFIYYVSLKGVTGERSDLPADLTEHVRYLKSVTETPVAVGFGVSTPAQAKQVAAIADGVIVGSALVKENHTSGVEGASKLARDLASACRR